MLFVTGCIDYYNDISVTNISSQEEDDLVMTSRVWLQKFTYASSMGFDMRIYFDGEILSPYGHAAVSRSINPADPYFNPFYTDFIFVHSEEEAEQHPNNVITAWPGDNEWTHGLIEGMHWAVSRGEAELVNPGMFGDIRTRDPFTLEDFGLTYPITITDLVDNWEKVNALWRAFTGSERGTIRRFAPPWMDFWGDGSGTDAEPAAVN